MKLTANVTFEDLAFLDTNRKVINKGWRPIRASNYASQMKNWLEVFPREQILVIDSSALTSDPATQMQRVENFLGLRPFYTRDNFYFNPAKGFYCFRRNASVPGQCLEGNKGRQRKTVDANTVSRLRKHFAASNEMFWKQIGEIFNWPQE
jgi:hypothetical protein